MCCVVTVFTLSNIESNKSKCCPAPTGAWVPANARTLAEALYIHRHTYEYLRAESARLVLPCHLRGRTVQLITCGTVQILFDFLLHLIYFCY